MSCEFKFLISLTAYDILFLVDISGMLPIPYDILFPVDISGMLLVF